MPERWQAGHIFSVRPQPACAGALLAAACSDGALRVWDRSGGAGASALSPVAAVRHAHPGTRFRGCGLRPKSVLLFSFASKRCHNTALQASPSK